MAETLQDMVHELLARVVALEVRAGIAQPPPPPVVEPVAEPEPPAA